MLEEGDKVTWYIKRGKVGTIKSFYRGMFGGWGARVHFDDDPENYEYGISLKHLKKVKVYN